jgi:CelD/BcsL family acetyltransferase involved in cellulose biosynthesis
MHVNSHHDFQSLSPLASAWNDLAGGVPFRRWEWVEAWWRHYGCREDGAPKPGRELFVLTVWNDNDELIGIAPWYRILTRSGARVVRFLGDGEVCSDYVSILCHNDQEEHVAEALADWLTIRNQIDSRRASTTTQPAKDAHQIQLSTGDCRWDRLELTGTIATDTAMEKLLAKLKNEGNLVHYRRPMNVWRASLPSSWEEFLMILSKAHRNRLRRADKLYLQSESVITHVVQTNQEFDEFFEILIKLHQGRWQQRGLPGAFASPPFRAFHREIAAKLWADGRATLTWLELDGSPLAAEYRLHGDGVMYAYQSGIDPDRLQIKPGELANMVAIKNAIERGQQGYDFLRGDEPYKARWRAQPQVMLSVRVIPSHASARLRHGAWLAGQNVKHWIKSGLKTVGQWKAGSAAAQEIVSPGED